MANEQIFYTVAIESENREEYLRQLRGDDCFTDDIGLALLYPKRNFLPALRDDEYVVKALKDEEGGISVLSREDGTLESVAVVMDDEYKEKYTEEWRLQKEKGVVQLWNYYDSLEKKEKYCLIVEDVVKSTMYGDSNRPFEAFELVDSIMN